MNTLMPGIWFSLARNRATTCCVLTLPRSFSGLRLMYNRPRLTEALNG